MKEMLIICATIAVAFARKLAFPESANQRIDAIKQNRQPLYAPDKCPGNQWLYPGDKESDWICDCAPGYVYYPLKEDCFHVYRQGPCEKGQFLLLKKPEVIPTCVENRCKEDGLVMFNNKCYRLDKPGGPCEPVKAGGGIFGVNTTTLEVECLKGTEPLSLFKIPKRCPPGTVKDSNGDCREAFE